MKTIDGSRGEGGGQVLRTSLALAAATRTPVVVENVRVGREQPGLKAGHLAAVHAIAQLCDGEVEGAHLGSTRVALRPGVTLGDEHVFAIETAGPVSLLLQCILPAMVASRQTFRVTLRGGTNVAWAPQWDDTVHVHLAMLRKLGVETETQLLRRGFFPQGGGEAAIDVSTPALHRVDWTQRGELRALHAAIPSHGLPRHVMERASLATTERLRELGPVRIETDFHRGPGTGMSVACRAECAHTILGADAVGRKGTRVEDVVDTAAAQLLADFASGAGLDIHQADQMPIFLSLAGGGAYTCRHLTPHARTVLDLIPEFLPVQIETTAEKTRTRVEIRS